MFIFLIGGISEGPGRPACSHFRVPGSFVAPVVWTCLPRSLPALCTRTTGQCHRLYFCWASFLQGLKPLPALHNPHRLRPPPEAPTRVSVSPLRPHWVPPTQPLLPTARSWGVGGLKAGRASIFEGAQKVSGWAVPSPDGPQVTSPPNVGSSVTPLLLGVLLAAAVGTWSTASASSPPARHAESCLRSARDPAVASVRSHVHTHAHPHAITHSHSHTHPPTHSHPQPSRLPPLAAARCSASM